MRPHPHSGIGIVLAREALSANSPERVNPTELMHRHAIVCDSAYLNGRKAAGSRHGQAALVFQQRFKSKVQFAVPVLSQNVEYCHDTLNAQGQLMLNFVFPYSNYGPAIFL